MARSKARKKKKKKADDTAPASESNEGPSLLAIVGSWFSAAGSVAVAIDLTRQFFKANPDSDDEAAAGEQQLVQLQNLQSETEETQSEDMP